MIIGIDPGQKGAIGIIDSSFVEVKDMFLLPSNEIDTKKIYKYIKNKQKETSIETICFIEKAQAMAKNGSTSIFTYGEGYGKTKAVFEILEIPYIEIRPVAWKKYFGLNNDKTKAITFAMKLFPNVNFYGTKGGKKDGRAEALLIAKYGEITFLNKK